ncbi:coiled-coil domain-containing protein like protein [Ditylenchus destructor]|uniref:Coiled-coil domain-containing protein like protein n=1 Tax=Ditylenchus destructor TaxID=166010 RepID=A0AAD4R3D7_9BILA|nr:coiled-coil domain-containing protein like protein [Ditylenchus destructor]
MGERKGQNHYYPADFNYKVHKNLNNYHGTHALRERAKKIKEGILTIRFEMPFNVWCLGCNNHVGMGVRYNAEKKKIGMYYTTPLYEFRMKCHLCDNYYVIRTDPKNFDYELVEGLRRQEKRFDPADLNNLGAVDRTFNLKLSSDAMFKKEHDADDKQKLESEETSLARLEWIQSRMHDDYSVNAYLRKAFRGEKKSLNDRRTADEDLKKRLSTSIHLQPELSDDKILAKQMLTYKDSTKSYEDRSSQIKEEILSKPLFGESSRPSTSNDAKSIVKEQLRKKRTSFDTFRSTDLDDVKRNRNGLGIIHCKQEDPSYRNNDTQKMENYSPIKSQLPDLKESKNPVKPEMSGISGSTNAPFSNLSVLAGYGSDSSE